MKTSNLTESELQNLVNEYKADPNCWPALWITGEDLSKEDEQKFISLIYK